MRVILVSGAVANKPFNGGEAWVRLSWALGLRRLGFRVFFVEQISPRTCVDAAGAPSDVARSANLQYFQDVMRRFGLGESSEELVEVFRDLGTRGVDILTVGQYLRPSKDHLPIARFYQPEEFVYLRDQALRFGFRHVESGPMVRSSYHAHEQAESTATPRAVS